MKKLTYHVLFLAGLFLMTSCEDEEISSDEYYVKYEVRGYSSSSGELDVKVLYEPSRFLDFIISQRSSWEVIVGPVQKGFLARLDVNSSNRVILYTSISVSKNDSPFALKKTDNSDTPRSEVDVRYEINY